MIEDLSKIDDVTEHPRIGIFGLGIMGGAIAKNLVDDGYQVFGITGNIGKELTH